MAGVMAVIGSVGCGASVALAVGAAAVPASRRSQMLRRLAKFGNRKLVDTRPRKSLADQLDSPLGRTYVKIADGLAAGSTRERLHRWFDYAGNPTKYPLETVIRLRPVSAILLSLFGWAFVHGLSPHKALLGVVFGAVIGLHIPDILVYNMGTKRQIQIDRTLPDTLDALVIGVEAGLGLDSAMLQCSQMLTGPMPDEIHRALQEMKLGVARTEALRALAARTTVRDLKSLVTALVQAGELGISVAGILREHSSDQRLRRRQRAEEQAQKVAVKMLFPVLFCFFPAIFVVVIGPAVLRLIKVFSS